MALARWPFSSKLPKDAWSWLSLSGVVGVGEKQFPETANLEIDFEIHVLAG